MIEEAIQNLAQLYDTNSDYYRKSWKFWETEEGWLASIKYVDSKAYEESSHKLTIKLSQLARLTTKYVIANDYPTSSKK